MSNDIYTVAINAVESGFDSATKAIDGLKKKVEDTAKAEGVAAKASTKNTQAKQRLTRATREVGNAQQRARQHFLATANSIAVLDGPLGGVASRFSAFGVLIGRIGIPLAALSIGLSAFTFAAQRAIREFAEWEKSLSTIENRLNSVGNQFNLTTQEIVGMSEQLALSTLASEKDVLSAANSLLTFRNISTDLFGDVLKSAQDLAASGFGNIESETLRLAKALEDPRQGLTSLSRAGITFTRQQRDLIISMVDTGREAEAMGLVLRNVERQVGGAGLAQANNTLAGSFDTIGQATRTATRRFGEFVVESLLVRGAIDRVAEAADDFVRRSGLDEQTIQIENLVKNMGMVKREIESLESLKEDFGFLDENQKILLDELNAAYTEQADLLEQVKELKEENLEQSRIERDLAQSISDLNRRAEALDNLESQIDLQRTLVGVTREQERVQRALFAEGFGGDVWANINQQVNTYANSLRAAGVETGMIHRLTSEMRSELEGARDVAERYAQVFRDQSIAREINQIEESTASSNELLRIQVQILEEARAAGNDNLTVTEARRQAELQMQVAMLETEMAIYAAAWATETLAGNAREAEAAFQGVARMAQLIADIQEGADLQLRVGELGRTVVRHEGGGGASGPSDAERIQEFFEALERENQIREKIIGKSKEQAFIIERRAELEDRIRGINADLIDQYAERIEQMIEEELRIQKLMDAEQKRQDMRETFERNIESALMSMVDGSKSVEDAFKNMLRNIILEIYQQQVAKSLASNIMSLFPFAKGGAFSGGNVVPFAQGGVVSSPTLFPMSGRKTGLMGEAGPEAIMPLTRGRDGKLGVKAEGGGGSDVVINFNVSANGDESVKQILLQQMPAMTESVKAAVADGKRRGGSYGRAFG